MQYIIPLGRPLVLVRLDRGSETKATAAANSNSNSNSAKVAGPDYAKQPK